MPQYKPLTKPINIIPVSVAAIDPAQAITRIKSVIKANFTISGEMCLEAWERNGYRMEVTPGRK